MRTFSKALIVTVALFMACIFTNIASINSVDAAEFDMFSIQELTKQPGKDFVILQFTDTHIGSKSQGEREVFPYMRKWVKEVNPDLIVITGDGVKDAAADGAMLALIEEINAYDKPWAYIFGNHEKDATVGVRGLSQILSQAASLNNNVLYREGDFTKDDRQGNYVINIKEGKKNIYSLFMMNTGREYNTFSQQQTEWYIDGVKKISEDIYNEYAPFKGKVAASMVFHHIPIDEYQLAANMALSETYSRNGEVFGNIKVGQVPARFGSGRNDEMAHGQTNGQYALYEDERSQAGFFSVVKDLHSTTHMFCGHRHANDATILYEGVTLSFGTKSGRGSFDGYSRSGCAVITIKDKTSDVEVKHLYDV